MIKAFLFDLDGVVVDSEPLYAVAEIRLFREYGVEIPDEDWKLFRGCTEEMFYKISMERYKIDEDREVFMNKGRAYIREEFSRRLAFMDGFPALYNRLHENYRLGLVTSSPKPMFDFVDEQLDLRRYFPQVLYGGMTQNGKPHPEPYLTMMDRLAVKPEECIVVEDSVHGIEAGLASGAVVIALTGSVDPEHMPEAHCIIHHLDEITPDLIGKFNY